jgi:chromosome partitioning protein
MTRLITITNQKGGVGKTTTTVHLAHSLALAGHRVLVVDLDPQGQAAIALNIEQTPAVFSLLISEQPPASLVVNARERLAMITGNKRTASAQGTMAIDPEYYTMEHLTRVLKPVMAHYDYILFDTSPSVGGLQERAIWASDWVLVPSATEFLSLTGVANTVETLTSLHKRGWKGKLLGVLPTLYDTTTRESQDCLAHLEKNFAAVLLRPIHRATLLRECASDGQTVFEKNPESRAAQDYQSLVNWVQAAR